MFLDIQIAICCCFRNRLLLSRPMTIEYRVNGGGVDLPLGKIKCLKVIEFCTESNVKKEESRLNCPILGSV